MNEAPTTLELRGDPPANLVVNALRMLAAGVTRVVDFAGGPANVAPAVRQVHNLLDTLAAEPPRPGRAPQLREQLLPLVRLHGASDDPAQVQLWRDLRRFIHDLTYLDVVEHGGLDAITALLNERLATLRSSSLDAAQSPEAAAKLNDVLRRAIYLFPHLANGVAVELAPNPANVEAQLERYLGRPRVNRAEFAALWKATGSPMQNGKVLAHLPLPYAFTAETDEARRKARRESWEDVVFLPHRLVVREDVVGASAEAMEHMRAEIPPTLVIRTAFDRDLGLSRVAYFLAREVVRLEFTSAGPFLKAYNAKVEQSDPASRPDPLTHYMVFRDFGDIGQNARLAKALGVSQLAEQSLFEPGYTTGLLDVGDDEEGRQWLERGFGYLALMGRGHAAPQLLRFENVEVRYDDESLQSGKHSPLQRALYQAALDPDDPLRAHATVIEKPGMIAELMQTPVAPRGVEHT